MKHLTKPLLTTLIVGLFTSNAILASEAATPEHTFTTNVGLYSQYIYRGISQTNKKPALQGGIDYAHASGFYLGTWGSNISWISDATANTSSSLELDVYGGFKKTIGDVSYDAGVLYYKYPGSYSSSFVSADTTEIYGQAGWKWVTLKYSHSLTNLFGIDNSKNSYYLDLSGSIPINDQFSVNVHAGRQKYKGENNSIDNDQYSYTDYKVEGVMTFAKDWSTGVGYTKTNAGTAAYTNPQGTFLGDGMAYAFVKRAL